MADAQALEKRTSARRSERCRERHGAGRAPQGARRLGKPAALARAGTAQTTEST